MSKYVTIWIVRQEVLSNVLSGCETLAMTQCSLCFFSLHFDKENLVGLEILRTSMIFMNDIRSKKFLALQAFCILTKIILVELVTQSKGVGNINEVTNNVGKLLKIPMLSLKSHCPVMYKWTISGIIIII